MAKYIIKNIEEIICICIFIVMLILGFLNVVVRNLTNYSLASSQEIVINGFVLLTIYGAAIAVKKNQIIYLSFFDNIRIRGLKTFIKILCFLINITTLFFVIYFSIELLMNQINSEVTSSALQIPSWIYSLPIPFGFILIVLRQIQFQFFTPQGK